MPSLNDTLAAQFVAILRELRKLQSEPKGWKPDTHDPFPLPRMISAGDKGSILVNRAIDDAIHRISEVLWAADRELSRRYLRREWGEVVRSRIGLILSEIDLDEEYDQSAGDASLRLRDTLRDQAARSIPVEFVFGCTLFGDPGRILPSVGNVTFEPRQEWLQRQQAAGSVSPTTARRLMRAWDEQRLRARKPSADSAEERLIKGAIGSAPFICSVPVVAFGSRSAESKALLAARIATVALALVWQRPSKALEGINLNPDENSGLRRTLTISRGRVLGGGHRILMPHAPWLRPEEWNKQVPAYAPAFRVVGEVIELLTSPSGDVQRPELSATLLQALLWFYQACREEFPLVAIVKFSAALDALACGKGVHSIKQMLDRRVGLKPDTSLWSGGPTTSQAVERLYNSGRSQTIHGSNHQVPLDWTPDRDTAEQLARLALLTCLDWAAEHPACDDRAVMAGLK